MGTHGCASVSHAFCRGHQESLFEPVPVLATHQRVNADSLGLRAEEGHRTEEFYPSVVPIDPTLQGLHPLVSDSPGGDPSFWSPRTSWAALGHLIMWSVSA